MPCVVNAKTMKYSTIQTTELNLKIMNGFCNINIYKCKNDAYKYENQQDPKWGVF